jgi:hypothetical protein
MQGRPGEAPLTVTQIFSESEREKKMESDIDLVNVVTSWIILYN